MRNAQTIQAWYKKQITILLFPQLNTASPSSSQTLITMFYRASTLFVAALAASLAVAAVSIFQVGLR